MTFLDNFPQKFSPRDTQKDVINKIESLLVNLTNNHVEAGKRIDQMHKITIKDLNVK